MKLLLIFLGFLYIFFPTSGHAQSWIKIGEDPSIGLVTELDRSSVTKYQGLVAFKIRSRRTKISEYALDSYQHHHLFVVCNTAEVWDIASDYFVDASRSPKLDVEPGMAGLAFIPRNRMLGRSPHLVDACKRGNNRAPLEVPISDAADSSYVLLVHETRIVSGLVSVWLKERKTRKETSFDSDGKPLVFQGVELKATKYIPNGDYTMTNWLSNCKDETIAIVGTYEYTFEGKVKTSYVTPKERLVFSTTVPESVGRRVHDLSCQLR